MESIFINAGLAAGVGLAALPVILHLFMRPTPKHVVFPALRLIRERQKRARRTLKVKNWLLLILRMALVALMALALARPRLYSQTPLGDQDQPTALAFIFDTSLSMQYTEKGKNRLTEAKERALEILEKIPDGSQVFVVDSADPAEPVSMSPAAARKRIEGLALRPANRPLNTAVGQAYAAIVGSDRPRHEVYVLTDLAASAWDPSRPVEGIDKRESVDGGVQTFILRLTPKDARDLAVIAAEPAAVVATEGQPLDIVAKVRAAGPGAERVAELWLDGQNRGKQSIKLPDEGETEVRFTTPPRLESGLHRGEIRLTGGTDAMAFDDTRYFTFRMAPPSRVLVVSETTIDAEFVATALQLDPGAVAPGTPEPFKVERIRASEFGSRSADSLRSFACIFWLNVGQPRVSDWGKLNEYVRGGGGLVIGLGERVQPAAYNQEQAASLSPATLEEVRKPNEPTNFSQLDAAHPLFQRYPQPIESDLSAQPVYRHWAVKPAAAARTLLRFADGAPALLERVFEGVRTGRVLLWTTPLSRRPRPDDPGAWNEFPRGWSFVYLMTETIPYVSGAIGQRLSYEAGEDVVLPLDPTRRLTNYVVQGPDAQTSDRQTPAGTSSSLVIVAPQAIGQWTVTGSGQGGVKDTLGFSVNPPVAETSLTALDEEQLDRLFGGKDRYQLADSPEKLERAITVGRIGREIFPWIMALILILITAENLLANRFHREAAGPVVRPA